MVKIKKKHSNKIFLFILPLVIICVLLLVVIYYIYTNDEPYNNVVRTPNITLNKNINETGDYHIKIIYISSDTPYRYIEYNLYDTEDNLLISGNLDKIDENEEIDFIEMDGNDLVSQGDEFILYNSTVKSNYTFLIIFYPSGAVLNTIIL